MSYQLPKRGKNTAWRTALTRNLCTDLVVHKKIVTTHTKCKETQKHVEKLITLAKKGDLASIRKISGYLRNVTVDPKKPNENATYHLVHHIAPKYMDRNGGCTQIIKMEPRRGDSAKISMLKWI